MAKEMLSLSYPDLIRAPGGKRPCDGVLLKAEAPEEGPLVRGLRVQKIGSFLKGVRSQKPFV